jgi:hypothetical protein
MPTREPRRFLHPLPDETFTDLVGRALPGEPPAAALAKLKSWNLHIFLRRPPGVLLGSDIVFIEDPK